MIKARRKGWRKYRGAGFLISQSSKPVDTTYSEGSRNRGLNLISAVIKITSRKTDQESIVTIIKPPGGWEGRREVIQGYQMLLLKKGAKDIVCSGCIKK